MTLIELYYEIAKKNIIASVDHPFLIRYKGNKYSYRPYIDWFDNEWKVGFICEDLDEDFNKELCISDLSELNNEIDIIYDNREVL